MAQSAAVEPQCETNIPESSTDAAASASISMLEGRLQDAMQQIQTLKTENQRLHGTSFRLEAALLKCQAPDTCSTLAAVKPKQPILLDPVIGQGYASSPPQTLPQSRESIVGNLLNQRQATTVAEKGGRKFITGSRPSLELISSHSSSDSNMSMLDDHIAAAADEPAVAAQIQPNAELHTADTLRLPAAAAVEHAISNCNRQPPSPPPAVYSPFAAYSSQAFADSSSSSSSSMASSDSGLHTTNHALRGTLSLQCSSSQSLICSLQLHCTEFVACDRHKLQEAAHEGSMQARPSTARDSVDIQEDNREFCSKSNSKISIGHSVPNAPLVCSSETVCVVQHNLLSEQPAFGNKAVEADGIVAKADVQQRTPRRRLSGWFGAFGRVFFGCFVCHEG